MILALPSVFVVLVAVLQYVVHANADSDDPTEVRQPWVAPR